MSLYTVTYTSCNGKVRIDKNVVGRTLWGVVYDYTYFTKTDCEGDESTIVSEVDNSMLAIAYTRDGDNKLVTVLNTHQK